MFKRGLHRAQFFKGFVFQAHSLQYQNALKYISRPVSISKTAMSLNSTVQIQLWHFEQLSPEQPSI